MELLHLPKPMWGRRDEDFMTWEGEEKRRHQYTREEIEQLRLPWPIWIEGIGIRQLQWGGWEVVTHIHNGRLCCKGEKDSEGLLLDLYGKHWIAYNGPPTQMDLH